MSRTPYRVLATAVLVGWLCAVAPVSAAGVAPVIKDGGKFFSDDARAKADKKIREIYHDFNKDLLIETFPEVPADKAKNVDFKDKEARNHFFEEWARDRAHDAEVNGVYILICKEPAHLQVEVGNETQKKAFTLRDRTELIKILTTNFREKKYDEGLLEAVDFVGRQLKANGARAGARSESITEWGRRTAAGVPAAVGGGLNKGGGAMEGLGGLLCVGLVILVGLWIVVALFRALTGGGNRGGYAPGGGGGYAPGYGGGGGGGGGGFMTSLLGGMFGAAAGNWMYNSFFGGGGSHSWGGSPGAGGAGMGGADPGSPPDTDYSGGGADFGGGDDGGGGGDFGGNDGGGGGGDFGGGGGDFGGGGGDVGGGGGSDF